MPLRIKDVSLYTVRDVAYRLGVAEGTVRKYLRDGKMVGRKHAGAWHVTEESLRAFLRQSGDDLGPDDVPTLVIQVPVHVEEDDAEEDSPDDDENKASQRPEGMDELVWLLLEAKRLKREARRLERRYIDPNLPDAS